MYDLDRSPNPHRVSIQMAAAVLVSVKIINAPSGAIIFSNEINLNNNTAFSFKIKSRSLKDVGCFVFVQNISSLLLTCW